MDSRKALWLASSVLCGLMGCTSATTGTALMNSKANESLTHGSGQQYKMLVGDGKTKQVKVSAETCCKIGDVQLGISKSEQKPANERDNMRELARKSYLRAIELDANYTPAYRSLAQLHISIKEYDKAIEVLRRAQEKLPNDLQLTYDIAMLHGQKKEWEPAIAHLSRAMQADPENRIYRRALGFMYARAGRFEQGYDCLRAVMPEAEARYNTARMLHQLGQDDACKAQLQLALTVDANLADARAFLAELERPASGVQQAGAAQPTTNGVQQAVHYAPQARPVQVGMPVE